MKQSNSFRLLPIFYIKKSRISVLDFSVSAQGFSNFWDGEDAAF
ncbi:hypothetical protein [Epilithonimonas vandammei]|nr:hypothetical protein [Epilithonimonas vandammei]